MTGIVTIPPPILWAQRSDVIYITINTECTDQEYKFTKNSMYFKGTGVPDKKLYEVTLNFSADINADNVVCKNATRTTEFMITKDDIHSPFWKSLTNDKTRLHFVKADFNKWQEESDDEEEKEDHRSMSDVLGNLSNNKNAKPDMGDLPDFSLTDSDDDEIPNLE